jgi:hypothetical protein
MADRQARNALPSTANGARRIPEARPRCRFPKARRFRADAVLQRHAVGGPPRRRRSTTPRAASTLRLLGLRRLGAELVELHRALKLDRSGPTQPQGAAP